MNLKPPSDPAYAENLISAWPEVEAGLARRGVSARNPYQHIADQERWAERLAKDTKPTGGK